VWQRRRRRRQRGVGEREEEVGALSMTTTTASTEGGRGDEICRTYRPSGMVADKAVRPPQPARSKAVSPTAFHRNILRGGDAA
jgi:hypothetical protein